MYKYSYYVFEVLCWRVQACLDSGKQFEQHERSVEEAVAELCEQFPDCAPEKLRAAMLKASRAQATEFEARHAVVLSLYECTYTYRYKCSAPSSRGRLT